MPGATSKPRSSKRAPRQEKARVPAVAATPADSGFAPERLAFLLSLREKINCGFYNTEAVLDDLSYSFTKAVDALV
ncbi:MAG: hypothetical protein FWB85_03780 [Chitinispirillia bacterium]|nr:hypothetical protein [Chitinispirillia bacterium]MCL2241495.1 hypothetical protein [Chitinispirillia bacterium]